MLGISGSSVCRIFGKRGLERGYAAKGSSPSLAAMARRACIPYPRSPLFGAPRKTAARILAEAGCREEIKAVTGSDDHPDGLALHEAASQTKRATAANVKLESISAKNPK
jgi:hypothetical protein